MIEIQHIAKPKDGPAPRWFHVAVALSMVISAISALIATLHTRKTMTELVEQNAKLVRATSTPVLEFSHGNLGSDGVRALDFSISNVGSGMARVVWFELSLDGKTVPNLKSLIQRAAPGADPAQNYTYSRIAKRVFPPGARKQFFGWVRPPSADAAATKAWDTLESARFDRLAVQACYCSVFQECWVSQMDGSVPRPVEACSDVGHASLGD